MGAGLTRIRHPAAGGFGQVGAARGENINHAKKKTRDEGPEHSRQKNTTRQFKRKMKSADKTTSKPDSPWVKSRVILNTGCIDDSYEDLDQTIGHGTTGLVRLYRCRRTQEEVAVKFIRKENFSSDDAKEADISLINHEIQVLMRCQGHRGLIQLLSVFETSSNVIIVMEYACGGELFRRLMKRGFCSEQEAYEILMQVTEGLQFLHSHDVVHRDVKPQNILLTDDEGLNIKLADFGLSKVLKSNKALKMLDADGEHEKVMKTACGTLLYAAPEVIQKKEYDCSVDLWALGVLLFNILSGEMPFDTVEALLARDFGDKFQATVWQFVSQEAKDLIDGLLQTDPKKRLTCSKVLSHPWVEYIKQSQVIEIPQSVLELINAHISRTARAHVEYAIYHSAQTDILWQIFRSIEESEQRESTEYQAGKIKFETLKTKLRESGYTNMEVTPTSKIVVDADGNNVKTHADTIAVNEFAHYVSKYLQDSGERINRRRQGISLKVHSREEESGQELSEEQRDGDRIVSSSINPSSNLTPTVMGMQFGQSLGKRVDHNL